MQRRFAASPIFLYLSLPGTDGFPGSYIPFFLCFLSSTPFPSFFHQSKFTLTASPLAFFSSVYLHSANQIRKNDMGVLEFDCVTTNAEATTFYGLTNAAINRNAYGAAANNMNIVLVKSNISPTSLATTNWSFLSSYSSLNLATKDNIPLTAGCAVSSKGVVTFVAAHYMFLSSRPYSEHAVALRWDPLGSLDPARSQGSGGWSLLTLSPAFGPVTLEKISLYYTTVAGVETLNIAFVDDPTTAKDPSMVFGTYNEATKTFNPTGRWALVTNKSCCAGCAGKFLC